MLMGGNRPGQSLVTAAAGKSNGLLYLTESLSKTQFLVDTDAEISVQPATGLDTRTS